MTNREPTNQDDEFLAWRKRNRRAQKELQDSSRYTNSAMAKLSFAIDESVERLSKTDPKDVQGIAASQIQLLTNYYDLVLVQASRSFRSALIAAAIGLAFFIAAVAFLLAQQSREISIVSLISGSLIEVISGINFYLYGKTSTQLADFHNRLDTTQRYLLANSLCEALDGDSKKIARLEIIRKVIGLTDSIKKDEVTGQLPPQKP